MGLLIRFARQWVAGETLDEAVLAARAANARGIRALLNYMGEHYRERGPVEATVREYLGIVARLRDAGIHGDVSVKPTQLGILIDREYALAQTIPIVEAARAAGGVLWVDMEAASTVPDTLWVHERLFEAYGRVGLCLQANLRRTRDDLSRLLDRGAPIRLVKGAYRETPDVAFTGRAEIDREYLAHLETLFREGRDFEVASHDGRIVARALELAKDHATPFEFAMLKGVRDPLKADLVAQGHRVTEYIPYGPSWLPYFTRRLRERPRNVVTMLRSLVSG